MLAELQNKPLLASVGSKKLHLKFCPYAQNIKQVENALYFDLLEEAEQFGFEKCRCLYTYDDKDVIDERRLREKFQVLQHFSEYDNPMSVVKSSQLQL